MSSFFVIPSTQDGLQSETITLDGETFTIQISYNNRDTYWYLDLLDSAGEIIRTGIKMVQSWPLLLSLVTAARPDGELLLLRLDGQKLHVTKRDLSVNADLIYQGDS